MQTADEDKSQLIIKYLLNNKAVIIATDTIYGILALKKNIIDQIKKRNKKTVKLINDISQINEKIPEDLLRIMNAFWPGPLTIIYKDIGYRIPNNKLLLKVIKQLNKPIYASSANISGQPVVKTIQEAKEIFKNPNIEYIDTQEIPKNHIASTILDYDTKQIKREGTVSKKELFKILWNN